MVMPVAGALVSGVLLGWIMGRDGKPTQLMIVCPEGNRTPEEINTLPLSPTGPLSIPTSPVRFGLEPIEEVLTRDLRPRGTSTTYGLDKMVNARLAENLTLIITSTLDQAITAQLVGHVGDSPNDLNSLVNIGSTVSITAGNSAMQIAGISLNLRTDWYPYIGLTIITATAPTTGQVQVYAYGRRWLKADEGI